MSIFPTTDDVPFTPRYLWRNGELIPWQSATVHVSHIGHASVSSVFEGIKAYWNDSLVELNLFRLQGIDESAMPPRIKAFSNYHNSRFGVMEALARGADWPIFLNRNYKVTEGPASCIAMIRRGQFVTPPLTSGILDSITRQTVLSLVPEVLGMEAVERDIDRTELYVADELFYLGTGWEILPILEVDGMKIGSGVTGPMTRKMDRAYHDVVRGTAGAWHQEWRTAVWNGTKAGEPAAETAALLGTDAFIHT